MRMRPSLLTYLLTNLVAHYPFDLTQPTSQPGPLNATWATHMPRICDRERRACVTRVRRIWPLWGCDLHPLPAARRLVQARGCKEPCDHVGPKVREEAATLARGPEVEVAAVRWLVAGLEPTWPSEVGDAVAREEELSRRYDAHTRRALLLEHTGRLWSACIGVEGRIALTLTQTLTLALSLA